MSEWGHWPEKTTQGWSSGRAGLLAGLEASRLSLEAHSTRGGVTAGEEFLALSTNERATTQYFTNQRKPLLLFEHIPSHSYFY